MRTCMTKMTELDIMFDGLNTSLTNVHLYTSLICTVLKSTKEY